jgi:hypothetical protein
MDELSVILAVDEGQKHMADKIVIEYHSYVPSARTVGRVLKYLAYYNGELVGTFWIGSGFKPTPKAILTHFGVGQKQFDAMFNTVADNKRFCMVKNIPNLGSRIIKEVRKRCRHDWKQRYGNELVAIVTTIGNGKRGSVYLADNWKVIGETAGLPSDRKSVSMKWDDSTKIKSRFIKPDGLNKKTILITTNLPRHTPKDRQTLDLFS